MAVKQPQTQSAETMLQVIKARGTMTAEPRDGEEEEFVRVGHHHHHHKHDDDITPETPAVSSPTTNTTPKGSKAASVASKWKIALLGIVSLVVFIFSGAPNAKIVIEASTVDKKKNPLTDKKVLVASPSHYPDNHITYDDDSMAKEMDKMKKTREKSPTVTGENKQPKKYISYTAPPAQQKRQQQRPQPKKATGQDAGKGGERPAQRSKPDAAKKLIARGSGKVSKDRRPTSSNQKQAGAKAGRKPASKGLGQQQTVNAQPSLQGTTQSSQPATTKKKVLKANGGVTLSKPAPKPRDSGMSENADTMTADNPGRSDTTTIRKPVATTTKHKAGATLRKRSTPTKKAAPVPKKKAADDGEEVLKRAFDIAWSRFQKRLETMRQDNGMEEDDDDLSYGFQSLKDIPPPLRPSRAVAVLNSIRIPKAGSSSLSVSSRALAGCRPDGYPCCIFPGDPVGSCPRRDLWCAGVTGCGGHRPHFEGDEPIISTFRDPATRLLSAFFYVHPHRPPVKQGHGWEVFKNKYVKQPAFRNIMVKMFSGSFAYNPFNPKIHTLLKAKKNACRTVWFEIVELPILSKLLMYEAPTFSLLIPNPVTFGLPALEIAEPDPSLVNITKKKPAAAGDGDGLRVNHNEAYATFKSETFVAQNGTRLVQAYNAKDYKFFRFLQRLFCARVEATPGLLHAAQAENIAAAEIETCREILHGPTGRWEDGPGKITEAALCGKFRNVSSIH